MLPANNPKLKSRKALATGCGLAAGWFVASTLMLPEYLTAFVPAIGAIGIAAFVPFRAMHVIATSDEKLSRWTLLQQMNALKQHTCINLVDQNNILVEVNDKLLELTGYSSEELIGKHAKFIHTSNSQEIADEIAYNLRNKKSWRGMTSLRCKDGSTVYTQATIMPLFDEDGNLSGSISVRTDVTRATEMLLEEQYAQTLYELRDMIWIVDSETEDIGYMNAAARAKLGLAHDDPIPDTLFGLGWDDDILTICDACRGLIASGEKSKRFETTFFGVPTEATVKFLPNEKGGTVGRYLVMYNDISSRLEQEQARSDFISTVTHELRTPLTSIKGAMGLLLSRSAGELPDKAVGLLDIAHRNADRLILIINDILDLDKISTGHMEFDLKNVDLAELIVEADRANAMLQQRFSVSLELKGVDRAIPFHTDPNRFIQVLTNLLTNAYKFSTSGDKIVVEAQVSEKGVQVSVTDQGTGIPQDEQHKIFARFADMSNSDRGTKGGTGLGLSICKAIIEGLDGEISFDTQEGVGTTFYFNLPYKKAQTSLLETPAKALRA